MRKLTAVISAAAVAVSLLIPISAGAASNQGFSYDFDASFTSDEWTASGGSGTTNVDKLNSGVTDGKLLLKKTQTSSPLYKIVKTNLGIAGDYTLSLDITRGSSIDNIIINMKDSSGTQLQTNISTSGAVSFNSEQLKYTNGTVVYINKESATFNITYTVREGNCTMSINSDGNAAFNQSAATPGTITASNYTNLATLEIMNNTNDGAGVYLDNIVLTPAATAEANTEAVDAAWAENIEAESNITVNDDGTITVDADKTNPYTVRFYKTTVKAGVKPINGGTITAKKQGEEGEGIANEFKLEIAANNTGEFYNMVSTAGKTFGLAIDWTYTFNEQ